MNCEATAVCNKDLSGGNQLAENVPGISKDLPVSCVLNMAEVWQFLGGSTTLVVAL